MNLLLLLIALARATPGTSPEAPVEMPEPELPAPAPELPAPAPEVPAPEAPAPTDAPAEVPVPAEVPATSAEAQDPQEALDAARQSYFEGEHDKALHLFLALRDRLDAAGETTDEVYVETMLYLGEVQYLLDDRAGAWDTFEALLGHRPDVSMSPFNHPREVVHWFELVKQRVQQRPPPPPEPVPPPPPLPAWAFAPFGAPQFVLGQNGRGVSFAVLQASLGGASIGTWIYLSRVNGPNHPTKWTDAETRRRVNVIRYAVQWPATLGFYGLWAASLLDARHTWRIQHPPPVSVGFSMGPQGPGLRVSARF